MSTRVTLKNVAAKAGVSNQLVSAVFSGRASSVRFSEATRRKVLEAAAQLGYRPNILAQSFRGKRSFLVGVLNRVDHGWMSDQMLRGIQEVLVRSGLTPLLLTYQRHEDEERNLDEFLRRQVDGMIVNAGADAGSRATYVRCRQAGVPMVQVMDNSLAEFGVPNVRTDLTGMGRVATRHLLGLGPRRVAHLTHDQYLEHRDSREQFLGYREAMVAAGLKPRVYTHSLARYRVGEPVSFYDCAGEGVVRLLASSLPTAVVCYECYGAFRLIEMASSRGLRVPADLAVIGGNDLDVCQIAKPRISTMRINTHGIGEAAGEEIIRMLDDHPGVDRLIPAELVVRGSSVPEPGAGA